MKIGFNSILTAFLLGTVSGYYAPQRVMVDTTNEFGICVLQLVSSKNENVAFSPYGLVSVALVLYEGARGPTAAEIHNTLRLPWDHEITRVGFRDMHRYLKSYFSNDGFLRGLVLSKPNVVLHKNYSELLQFYGFDVNPGLTTLRPEMTTTKTTTTTMAPTKPMKEEPTTSILTTPSSLGTTTAAEAPYSTKATTAAVTTTNAPTTQPTTTMAPNTVPQETEPPPQDQPTEPAETNKPVSEGTTLLPEVRTTPVIAETATTLRTTTLRPLTTSTALPPTTITTPAPLPTTTTTPAPPPTATTTTPAPPPTTTIRPAPLPTTTTTAQAPPPTTTTTPAAPPTTTTTSAAPPTTTTTSAPPPTTPLPTTTTTSPPPTTTTTTPAPPPTTATRPSPPSTTTAPMPTMVQMEPMVDANPAPTVTTDDANVVMLTDKTPEMPEIMSQINITYLTSTPNSAEELENKEMDMEIETMLPEMGAASTKPVPVSSPASNEESEKSSDIPIVEIVTETTTVGFTPEQATQKVTSPSSMETNEITNTITFQNDEAATKAVTVSTRHMEINDMTKVSVPVTSETATESTLPEDDNNSLKMELNEITLTRTTLQPKLTTIEELSTSLSDQITTKKLESTPNSQETSVQEVIPDVSSEVTRNEIVNDENDMRAITTKGINPPITLVSETTEKTIMSTTFDVSVSMTAMSKSFSTYDPNFGLTTEINSVKQEEEPSSSTQIPSTTVSSNAEKETPDSEMTASSLEYMRDMPIVTLLLATDSSVGKNTKQITSTENPTVNEVTGELSTGNTLPRDSSSVQTSEIEKTTQGVTNAENTSAFPIGTTIWSNSDMAGVADSEFSTSSLKEESSTLSTMNEAKSESEISTENQDATPTTISEEPKRKKRHLYQPDSAYLALEHRDGISNWVPQYQDPRWSYHNPVEHWFFTYSGGESVPVLTYTAYLPFAYITQLNALAVQLPLDDPRYYIIIILPEERRGLTRLLYDLQWCPLRVITSHLKTTAVYAVVPSFTVVKHVNLGPALSQLGIHSLFDPFRADLSTMSPEPHVFVRTIEQVVTVSLRKYHSNHRWFDATPSEVQQHFIANHPFAYFVLDKETQVALMAGTIVNPIAYNQ